MHKNTIKAFLIILLSIPFAQISHSQSEGFKHFEIDIHGNRHDFFEFIEQVEIIPLEETEKSLLSRVEFYFKIPNGIGIIQKQKNTVVLFDENGKYINHIYKFGEGPEEYRNLGTTWVENEIIHLYSSHSRNVLQFSLEGEYVSTKRVKYPKDILGGSLAPYQNGYIVQLLDRSGGRRANFHLMFLDRQFRANSYAAPKSTPHPFPANLSNRFSSFGNQFIWKKQLSDSIFKVKDGKPFFFMRFDFGEDWAWKEPLSSSTKRTAFDAIWKEDSKVWEVLSKVSQRYVFLTYHFTIMENGKGIIDRKTGKFYRFDMRKKNKEILDVFALQWEGEELVCSLQAYDVSEFIQNLDAEQVNIAGGLSFKDFEYSENPVLLRIKFKVPD